MIDVSVSLYVCHTERNQIGKKILRVVNPSPATDEILIY